MKVENIPKNKMMESKSTERYDKVTFGIWEIERPNDGFMGTNFTGIMSGFPPHPAEVGH